MQTEEKKPEIIVFAGPNGPGKSTVTKLAKEKHGGHGVPIEKIRARYDRCLKLIPELVKMCDVMHIYDNTKEPYRIFKKRKLEYLYWENEFWDKVRIEGLTGRKL